MVLNTLEISQITFLIILLFWWFENEELKDRITTSTLLQNLFSLSVMQLFPNENVGYNFWRFENEELKDKIDDRDLLELVFIYINI